MRHGGPFGSHRKASALGHVGKQDGWRDGPETGSSGKKHERDTPLHRREERSPLLHQYTQQNRGSRGKSGFFSMRDVGRRIDAQADALLALYKHLHTNPELSLQEERTAERMARDLKDIGFEVTTGVGGHGVVGVLKNGDGP